VDYLGAALLTSSVVSLLLGLMDFGTSNSWILIGTAIALFIALVLVESRAEDPILPLHLFRDRLFATAVAHGMLTGWALFGGITITPMLLGWVSASITGMRLILTVGHRRLGLIGTTLFASGAFFMTLLNAASSQIVMMIFVTMMGIGMGLSIPSFLVAVQTSVERRYLGTATSTLQFSRSIGGTLGVSVMGAALSFRLASNLSASGLDPELVARLLDPLPAPETILDAGPRLAMANAVHLVFVIAFVAAALGLVTTLFTPRKELTEKLPVPTENEPAPVGAD
jgi:MFS family permease